MYISKKEFVETVKDIFVIDEVMPRESSPLGKLYQTLGVFGVIDGAKETMLRTLERVMNDTDKHIRWWLQGGAGKYQKIKIDGMCYTYFIDKAENLYDYLVGDYDPAYIVDAGRKSF